MERNKRIGIHALMPVIIVMAAVALCFVGEILKAETPLRISLENDRVWLNSQTGLVSIQGKLTGSNKRRVYVKISDSGECTFEKTPNGRFNPDENEDFILVTGTEFSFENVEVAFEGEDVITKYIQAVDENGRVAVSSFEICLDEFAPVPEFDMSQFFIKNGIGYINHKDTNVYISSLGEISGIGEYSVSLNGIRYFSGYSGSREVGVWLLLEDGMNIINAMAYDLAGNQGSTEDLYLLVDTSKPLADIKINDVAYEENEIMYVPLESTVSLWATDEGDNESGLKSVSLYVNNEICDMDVSGNNIISDYSSLSENIAAVSCNIALGDYISDDDVYDIFFSATDLAGNVSVRAVTAIVDKYAPEIEGIWDENGEPVTSSSDYKYIYNSSKHFFVHATDNENGSGVSEITYCLVNDGCRGEEICVYTDDEGVAEFVIDADFKGEIYVRATDNVGNESDYIEFGHLIVESSQMAESTMSLDIILPDTDRKDADSNPLYYEDVDIDIKAEAGFSGIDTIKYTLSDDHDLFEEMLLYKDGENSYISGMYDLNLVTLAEKNLSVSNELNSIKLTVSVTDNAGYKIEKSVMFSKDSIRPIVGCELAGRQNEQAFEGFYCDDVTLNISVSERNASDDGLEIYVNEQRLQATSLTVNSRGDEKVPCEGDTYYLSTTFDNEGEYKIEILFRDMAGNTSDIQSRVFYIDKTSPLVAASLSENGEYSSDTVEALFSITDQFLNMDSVCVNEYVNGVLYNISPDFSRRGYTYSAQETFYADGVYSVSISCMDKAGNVSERVSTQNITLDRTLPEITVLGVDDRASVNGDCVISISIQDINFDENNLEYQLCNESTNQITLAISEARGIYGTTISFADITHDRCGDGVYSLKVRAVDKALNEAYLTYNFIVNRSGSDFSLPDYMEEINGAYLKGVEEISILEKNFCLLRADKTSIYLSHNGITEILTENDFVTYFSEGDSSGNLYTYMLSGEHFMADGLYEIFVRTEDMAGNVNDTRDKNFCLKFVIDNTSPVILPVNVADDMSVDTDTYRCFFDVNDNFELSDIKAMADGNQISVMNDGEKFYFDIEQSGMARNITIYAVDMAGNETAVSYFNVLITTNDFIRIFHDYSSVIGGFIDLFGLGGLFIVRRKTRIVTL